MEGWTQPNRNASMSGGSFDRALTLSDCQAACVQRFPNCVAINVNPLPSGLINCYLVPQLQQPIDTQNVDNYEIIISSDVECQPLSMY